jgi:hypothetical protein
MSRRNAQQKLGTTRGSPRRSRTAKASRISRKVGEITMCQRVGRMGLLSVDGSGQKNPDGSESPRAESDTHSKAAHRGVVGPAQNGTTESDYEVREGQKQTRRTPTNAGAGLSDGCSGKALSEMPAFNRTGENPPYGMIGGTVETSASFEARSAPLSYPSAGGRPAMVVRTATVIHMPD